MRYFSLIFIFIAEVVVSQPDLSFVRYTTQQGLSNNDVLSIYQDNQGFMWFGTKNGCSRFDGITFKNFKPNENITGLPETGWVNKIVGNNKNALWFAMTGNKASFIKYDFSTESFTNLGEDIWKQMNITKDKSDFWSLFYDSEGLIWTVTTGLGVNYYNTKTHEIEAFKNHIDAKKLSTVRIKSFFEDSDNNMWFATTEGLLLYNRKRNSFNQYRYNPNNPLSISSNYCSSIFQDSDGQIWVGTYGGLNKLEFSSAGEPSFTRYLHNQYNPFSLSNNVIYDINEDNSNNLLIATINGFCLMNKKTEKIYRYYSNDLDDESINSNLIRVIYKDRQKNIWVGTNNGLGKLQTRNFKTFTYSIERNSISHNKIQHICEAPNSKVWIANPKGIDVLDWKTGQFNFMLDISQTGGGLRGAPIFLCPENSKGMWIATWKGGVSYYDYTKSKITKHIISYNDTIIDDIFSVFSDNGDNLWIGTARLGLYLFGKQTGKHQVFLNNVEDKNTISSNAIFVITEDSDSNLWVGTYDGLNQLIDKEKGHFERYLQGVQINCITEGNDKNLWVGTTIGLFQFNNADGELKNFNADDGVSDNIFGIVEDKFGNLWISTTEKFIRFTPPSKFSSAKTIVYRSEEGVSVGDFNQRSCTKLSDGTIIFGGTKGLCMFNPSVIKNDTVTPNVVLTKLKIGNKTVRVGQDINDQIVLEKSITLTRNITLNHKNNAFTIEFSGLHYNMPHYIQYKYRMEGYDKPGSEWHTTNSANRRVEYMNLPGGSYTFKIKAANSYGVWSSKPTILNITILPPWWKSIWFVSLATSILILFIFFIIKRRTYNLQQQKRKLEKIVEQRTIELKEMNLILTDQKEQLENQIKKTEEMAEQLHEADQSKLRFFANVSHEFRTPLSLIIGPLEKILALKQPIVWDKMNLSEYHHLMHKSAKRLLGLINEVIDFRKVEQGRKKLNITRDNIISLVQEVAEVFYSSTEQKNIRLNIEAEFPVIECWFDPVIMEKILYNLISNAIKYMPDDGGEVNIQLTVNSKQSLNNEELIINNEKLENENTENDQFFILHYSPLAHENAALSSSFLIIKVSDTGIGIKKENLDKIFERFYREETKDNTAEGTGIGLAYTKELTELHKGSIQVESEFGQGTTFVVQFPIEKESYEGEIFSDSNMPINLDYTHSMMETQREAWVDKLINIDIEQNNNQPSILIVEDNADLREFIKKELELDYKVYEAENGKDGLKIAFEQEPELILSDIMMPVMDGIELCRNIKANENTSHIPFILLTAKSGDENQIKGLETGADDYISKPFNIKVLSIKIKNLFLLRKQMREKFSQSLDILPKEITHSVIDQQFIQKAIDAVKENMHNHEFDNDTFVDLLEYSRSLVYKKIKNLTGQSVSEFIRSIRLKAAAKLFLEGHDNISEVCYRVGYKYQSHLSSHFNKMFGVPPKQFIKHNLKKR